MSLNFCSLSSGSSGNCYVVFDEETALLIDAGISGKKILEGLGKINVPENRVKALLITHEHSDHIRSVRVVNKKLSHIKTYANGATWQCIDCQLDDARRMVISSGESFFVGGIEIVPFRTSHDAADSVGYTFRKAGSQISILTDTGYVTDDAYETIGDADLLVIEANHDPQVLRMCGRPLHVIKRIAGDLGHLSNEDAGKCISRIVNAKRKTRQILLAHLSGENNSPDLAKITVKNVLADRNIRIGDETRVDVIVRDRISPVYMVR